MLYILFITLVEGNDVPGYASLMFAVLFLGSIQLISIGVIGEYLGRMNEEIKKRPVYVVSNLFGPLKNRLDKGYQVSDNGIYVNEDTNDK